MADLCRLRRGSAAFRPGRGDGRERLARTAVARAELPGVGEVVRGRTQREIGFRLIGLTGLRTRSDCLPAAIKECYGAGIRTVMITGDYPGTAQAIAEQIGLRPGIRSSPARNWPV